MAGTSQLVAALERGARVVYVHGDASLLVERVVAEAEAWGVARCGLPAFNHGRWRATDDGAERALITARTMPMMADLRVVVLRELEHARDDLAEAVVDYLAQPSPSTLFVAVAGPFGKPRKGQKRWGTRFANAAKKVGIVVERKSEGVDRARFAREQAGSLGLSLGPGEAEHLIALVGDDLGRIVQELDKVRTWLGGEGQVTGEVLSEVCSAVAAESVWELTGGIARRDPTVALRALHRLLADGQSEHYLLAMVLMQLRKVLWASQLLRRGVPARDAGRQVKLFGRELEIVHQLARREPLDPADTLDRIAAANRAMNASPAGSRKVLEALVVDLCAAG